MQNSWASGQSLDSCALHAPWGPCLRLQRLATGSGHHVYQAQGVLEIIHFSNRKITDFFNKAEPSPDGPCNSDAPLPLL